MAEIQAPKIDVFLGLNNALNPCSKEYREGMAYVCDQTRVSESGLWEEQAALTACTSPPGQLTGWGNGSHVKNLAVQNVNKIITELATFESLAVGSNAILYSTVALKVTGASYVSATGVITKTGEFANTSVGMVVAVSGNSITDGEYSVTARTDNTITIDTGLTNDADITVQCVIMRQKADTTKSKIAAPTAPTVSSAPATSASGTQARTEDGIYFYIFTSYNDTYKHESVPAQAYKVDFDSATHKNIRMTLTANSDGDTIYIYRSKRSSPSDNLYNPTNIFYYVGTAISGSEYIDYVRDDEIQRIEYNGRGSLPPTDVDYIVPFNDRMLYFKGNILYWSSAGRPQEVAREYNLTIDGVTVPCRPKLSVGVYAEAKYEIAELASQTVTGALVKNERLWIWTDSMTGYILSSGGLEGYKFNVFRKGIGLVNDKCLASTSYGVFGADREGIWLLTNVGHFLRISDGIVDIRAGTGKSTQIASTESQKQAYITDSFGVWIPALSEYWWSIQNSATPSYIQIVFQANRGVFCGPYNHAITGGTNFVSIGGAQAFINDKSSPLVGVTAVAPSSPATAQELQFWFGQSSISAVKENVSIETIYESITADKAVTATVYQNNIGSTTGAMTSASHSHTDDNLVAEIKPTGSGRMMMLKLEIPADCAAAIIGIGYKANLIPWIEKKKR